MKLSRKNGGVKQRVIQFEINPNKMQRIILDCLTYAASKLWNIANYERMNWTKDSSVPYPDWYEQKKRLKDHFWYGNLPSQSAQEVLKQLQEAWQSFYRLKQTGGIQNPQPPGYKHSNFNIRYLNKGFKITEGVIRLAVPRQQKEYITQKHTMEVDFLYISIPTQYKHFEGNTKVIEIIPLPERKGYRVNMIIELPEKEEKKDNGIYMGIDLGVNNLITCYTSTGKSLIISGRQLLSINRYFDKEIGYYQSIAYSQQSVSGIKYPKDTRRIQGLYAKRRRQVHHLLHTATKKVMDFAEEEGVCRIIIGDITHIREDKDTGRINNQKFHKWPYKKITELLTYKAEDRGIDTGREEESYTSQCSPYETEISAETAGKGNRIHRGLYIVQGQIFNADCVGAYNILKKYLCRNNLAVPAVVGLDTPKMYRWSSFKGFTGNPKLAISMAM